MKNLKGIISLLLIIILSFSLIGCTTKDKEAKESTDATTDTQVKKNGTTEDTVKEVELTFGFWGSSGEDEAYQKAIEGIEEAVPGAKVNMQHYPSDADFWNNLPAQIAAGTAPDIISVTNEGYMQYIENGLFQSIESYIEESALDTVVQSAVDIWTVNDQLYGIPITAAPAAFIINKDMWHEAGLGNMPTTWDEVYEAAKMLTTDEFKAICVSDHEYHLTQYVLSYGGGWGNGQTIVTPENIQGLQFALDLYRDGLAISPKEAGLGWDGEVFAKGKSAMSTGGTWYVGFLKDAAPDMNYEIIPIPKGTTQASTMHSYAFVVLSDSENKDLATKAALYMARDEFQEVNAELTGAMPSSVNVSKTYFENNPKLKNLEAALATAQPFGYPADKKFMDELVKEFDEAIYVEDSTKTAEEILTNIENNLSR